MPQCRLIVAAAENFPAILVQVQVQVAVAAATFEQLAVLHLAEADEVGVWRCLSRHSLALGTGSFHDASWEGSVLAGKTGVITGPALPEERLVAFLS